jgi:hypothetical protein
MSVTHRPHYRRWVGGLQSRSGHCGVGKCLLLLLGIEPLYLLSRPRKIRDLGNQFLGMSQCLKKTPDAVEMKSLCFGGGQEPHEWGASVAVDAALCTGTRFKKRAAVRRSCRLFAPAVRWLVRATCCY